MQKKNKINKVET